MAGFNFSANLNVQLNAGSLRNVQTQLNSSLKGLSVAVDVTVSPSSQASLNALNGTVQSLSANLRTLQGDAAAAAASLGLLGSGLGRYGSAVSSASAASAQMTGAVRGTSSALRAAGNEAEFFGSQIRSSGQRLLAWAASAGSMLTAARVFREVATEAAAFDRTMVKISQVSSESAAEVRGIGDEVGRVALKWGASSAELIKAAEQVKQSGASLKETHAAIEALGKASLAPSFGDMAKTAQGAIAITRQFGIEMKSLEGALGSINAVAQNFAVESNDLIEAAKRAGGAFKAAGGDFHEFNAVFTAVRATTRESAETIATGLRTIFTRLQRPETIEGLKQLGVQLQHTREEAQQIGNLNLEGKFVGPLEAVRRISQELRGLPTTDPRFASVAEQIGGYRQIAQIIPLLQQQKLMQDALNTSMSGGNSLTSAAEKTQGALFVQVQKVREEMAALGRDILSSTGFRAFISDALKLASVLITVADAARPLMPILMGLAAVKIGQNIGSFASGFLRGPNPARFHSGGPVPGSGEHPAVLEGGEYVIKKSAVRAIGHDRLHRLNRYADGGVVGRESVSAAVQEFSDATGIPVSSLVKRIDIQDHVQGNKGVVTTARGSHNRETGTVTLSRKRIDSPEVLRRTVFHELGHAADLYLGRLEGAGGKHFASEVEGTEANRHAADYRQRLVGTGLLAGRGDQEYRLRARENFAEATAESLAGTALSGVSLLGQSERSEFVNKNLRRVAADANFGFVGGAAIAKRRAAEIAGKGWLNRLLGFASGGLAVLPEGMRAGREELVSQIQAHYEQNYSTNLSHNMGHPTKLAGAGLTDDVLARIPDGSRFLGSGVVGLAFRTPDGQVIRVQSSRAGGLAQRLLGKFANKRYSSNVLSTRRPDIEGVLQPLESERVGEGKNSVYMEKLPLVKTGDELPPRQQTLGRNLLRQTVGRQGYAFKDDHAGNFGLLGDQFVITDPGSVSKIPDELMGATRPDATRKYAGGGHVNAKVMPGEWVFTPEQAQRIGLEKLRRLNDYGQFARGGLVPGVGSTDSVPMHLPAGSFVVKKRSVEKIGARNLDDITRHFADGGPVGFADGGLTPAQRAAGLRSADVLSPAELNDLVNRTASALRSVVAKSGFGIALRDQAQSVLNEQMYQTGRLFDPAKIRGTNPTTGQPFTREDISSTDPSVRSAVEKKFISHVMTATNTGMARELRERARGGTTNSGDTDRELMARYVREHRTDPSLVPDLGPTGYAYSGGKFRDQEGSVVTDPKRVAYRLRKVGYGPRPSRMADEAAEAALGRMRDDTAEGEDHEGYTYSTPEKFRRAAAQAAAEKATRRAALAAQTSQSIAEDAQASGPTAAPRVGSMRDLLRRRRGGTPDADPGRAIVPYGRPGGLAEAVGRGLGPTPGGLDYTDAEFSVSPLRRGLPAPGPGNAIVPYRGGVTPHADSYIDADFTVRHNAVPHGRMPWTPGRPNDPNVTDAEWAVAQPGPGPRMLTDRRRGQYLTPEEQRRDKDERLYGTSGADLRREDIGDLAKRRAAAQMDRMGGQDRLSKDTQNAVLLEQHAKIQQEAVAATARQILAQGKATNSTEARKMAEEQYAEALRTGQKVVSDRGTGRAVGFTPGVEAQLDAGRRADGRSGVGGWVADRVGGLRDRASRFGGAVSRLNDRAGNWFGGRENLQRGVFFASGAASYAGAGLEHYAGSAENAVSGYAEGSYRRTRSAGGAISGAATGAVIGSVFGPLGTAAGAVVGGLVGLASSLSSTANEIRQVKLGNALAELGNKLSSISNAAAFGGGDAGAAASAGALDQIRKARVEMRGNAHAEADGWFSFDPKKYQGVLQKEERQGFGNQAGAANKVLGDFADDMVKDTVKRNPAVPLEELVKNLRDGNSGLNAELLRIISSLRGIPVSALEEEWKKNLQKMRNAAVAEQTSRRGQMADDRQTNSWGRLVTALDTAATSLEEFHQKAKTIADLFEGQAGATHVSSHSDAFKAFGTGDRKGFTEATDVIAAVGGDLGGKFRDSANTTNLIANILPGVLNTVASSRAFADDDPSTRSRRMLTTGLGYREGQALPREVEAAISSVVGGIARMKPEDFYKQTQTDTSKLGQKLLSGVADPQREYGEKALQRIGEEANRFADGLATSFRVVRSAGEKSFGADSARLSGTRQEAAFRAEAVGRRHDALDFVGLDQLRQPFQARQERLVGAAGPQATSPEFIARRLGRVRQEAVAATATQQEAFNRTGGRGPEFEAAATNLARLKDESSRLQEALRHLADASERNAGAQEKLAKIQADKDSRLSFGERFINASGDERVQMQRGVLLANQANNAGSIRGFQPEDQRLILQTIRSMGQTKISGFRGQPNAADLGDNLVRDFLGEGRQDPANRRAEAGLKKDILGGHRDAAVAQDALAGNLQALHADFFTNLKATHAEFFSKLATELGNQQRAEKVSQQGEVGKRLGDLNVLQGHGDVLKKAGITSDAQLKSLQGNRPLYDKLLAERKSVEDFTRLRKERGEEVVQEAGTATARKGNDYDNPYRSGGIFNKRLVERLSAAGVDDPKRVRDEFQRQAKERFEAAGFKRGDEDRYRSPEGVKIIQDSLRAALERDTSRQAAARYNATVLPAERDIRKAGLDPSVVAGPGGGDVVKALDALKGGKIESFAQLDSQLAETNKKFAELNAQIEALKKGMGGSPPTDASRPAPAEPAGPRKSAFEAWKEREASGFASGGSVGSHPGRPQGTDTVPAWLTPGEFVVPAEAAKANLAALKAMKAGAVYLAGGGLAEFNKEGEKREALRRELGLPPGRDIAKEGLGVDIGHRREDDEANPLFPTTDRMIDKILDMRDGQRPEGRARGGRPKADPVGDRLRRQALADPFGESGQVSLARRVQDAQAARRKRMGPLDRRQAARLAEQERGELSRALAGNYYEGQAQGLAYEGGLARTSAPLAAFGINRPGLDAQNAIAASAAAGKMASDRDVRIADPALNDLLRAGRADNVAPQRMAFADGGLVPGGFNGAVDDVPARLTRGEYVLSRPAVQAIGVSAVERMHFLAKGGQVQHLAEGGVVGGTAPSPSPAGGDTAAAFAAFNANAASLAAAFNAFGAKTDTFGGSVGLFGSKVDAFAAAVEKMPTKVDLQSQGRVEVVVNGAEAFARMMPAVEEMLQAKMGEAIRNLMKDKLPDA